MRRKDFCVINRERQREKRERLRGEKIYVCLVNKKQEKNMEQ